MMIITVGSRLGGGGWLGGDGEAERLPRHLEPKQCLDMVDALHDIVLLPEIFRDVRWCGNMRCREQQSRK